jgi:hypothetical protein
MDIGDEKVTGIIILHADEIANRTKIVTQMQISSWSYATNNDWFFPLFFFFLTATKI